jgi:hypothetical protein
VPFDFHAQTKRFCSICATDYPFSRLRNVLSACLRRCMAMRLSKKVPQVGECQETVIQQSYTDKLLAACVTHGIGTISRGYTLLLLCFLYVLHVPWVCVTFLLTVLTARTRTTRAPQPTPAPYESCAVLALHLELRTQGSADNAK